MSGPITHRLISALRQVPDLDGLADDALLQLVGDAANLYWAQGSRVFEQGDDAQALYVVLEGSIRIFEESGGEQRDVDRIEAPDCFGEQAVLGEPHTRTAEAVEDSELMVIPRAAIAPLLDGDPDLAARFRARMQERLARRAARD